MKVSKLMRMYEKNKRNVGKGKFVKRVKRIKE